MSSRYEFWIGRRYVRSRSSNGFISLISAISMLGIAIAVAVLIVVLSVVNGFERELNDRLLAMSAHASIENPEGGLTDWDLASTARKLIERVPGSLLLVPAAAAEKRGEVRYRRILVPLDGSPRAESVVPIAVRIAASEQAELLFVYIVPVPEITRAGPLDAEGAELERRVIEHNRRVATAYLDRLRARQAGSRVGVRVISDGNAQRGLERLIREEGMDLVVMSAHGHTGQTDSPCGSVTEHVLTHSSTPLLVVRDRALRSVRRVDPSSPRPLERPVSSGHATL